MSDLDFDSFNAPLRRSDFKEFYRKQGTVLLARYGVVMVGVLVLAPALVAAVELWALPTFLPDAPILIHIWIVVMLLFAIVPTLLWARIFRRSVRLAKFCRVNGLVYHERVKNLHITGAAFRAGRNSLTAPLVSGEFDEKKFTIGRYTVINERDDNKVEIFPPFTFARCDLPRKVPHIILKNRKSRVIPLTGARHGNATLTLEGDYAEQFTLVVPKNYERDALYIFTPDVIATIYDFAADAEIELVDDQLFLYTRDRKIFTRPDKMMALFAVLRQLNRRFHKQTKRYRDERATTGANVSASAKRLNLTGWSWLTIIWSAIIGVVVVFQILSAFQVQPFLDINKTINEWLTGLIDSGK